MTPPTSARSGPDPARTGALLTIDLDAICANWSSLQDRLRPGAACAAVVKADAYGLGAQPVAAALAAAGCRHFFVAHLEEGIALRPHLPTDVAIHILHGVPAGCEDDCAAHRLVPVLNSPEQVAAWAALSARRGRRHPAVLQVDTGMARLGLSVDEWRVLAGDHKTLGRIEWRFIMSHLACAEDQKNPANATQRKLFDEMRALLPGVRASLANSSGVFLGADYHYDLVRPGAALYGVAPVAGQPNPQQPVIRLEGRVVQTRRISAGTAVGYSHTWRSEGAARLATVAVGYADGYLRSLSNRGQAWFDGVALPIVGNVSMDTIILDVTALPEGRLGPGDWVDLIDPREPVDAVAGRAGTIGYEILTGLGARFARHHVGLSSLRRRLARLPDLAPRTGAPGESA